MPASEAVDAACAAAEVTLDAEAPVDAAPGEGAALDDDAPAKRRGRRGGRRRRRDVPEGNDAAVADAAADPDLQDARPVVPVQSTPSYSGPTPADPFGGSQAFDIFDAIEQAEQERAAVAATPRLGPASVPEPGPFNADSERTSGRAMLEPEPAQPDPEPEPALPEPVAAEPPVREVPALAEPVAAPAAPILVGAGEPAAEKKRGWWRR